LNFRKDVTCSRRSAGKARKLRHTTQEQYEKVKLLHSRRSAQMATYRGKRTCPSNSTLSSSHRCPN
jgi:hypothetical protein